MITRLNIDLFIIVWCCRFHDGKQPCGPFMMIFGEEKQVRYLLCLFIAACVFIQPATSEAKLKVVCSTPSLAAIARDVGGEHTSVVSLAKRSQDPHFLQARPDFLVILRDADLLIVNGLDLEVGWLPPLLSAARNQGILPGSNGYLDASAFVHPMDVPTTIDRSMGDVHPGGNPHYLMSALAGAEVASGIAQRLSVLDPAHKAAYEYEAARVAAALYKVRAGLLEDAAGLSARQRMLVVYHKSFAYLIHDLGLVELVAIEPKPGVPPDPAHVAFVLESMEKADVNVIIQEEYYPDTETKRVASLVTGRVVKLPGGADFEHGQTYVQYISEVGDLVISALSKQ